MYTEMELIFFKADTISRLFLIFNKKVIINFSLHCQYPPKIHNFQINLQAEMVKTIMYFIQQLI